MSLNFEKYSQKGREFIYEVAKEMGCPDDPDKASRVLRVVLHTLRDRITPAESMQFIAQLPMYIKAMYVDNWDIGKKHKRIKHIQDFINELRERSTKQRATDLLNDAAACNAIIAVFSVIKKHVSEGEIHDVMAVLPTELKEMWEESIAIG